jgi:tetratricopeptide (TPR) repeat protein
MAMSARELMDRAMQLHREGQLGAAASLYREILRSEPANFDAMNLLGNICLREGEADEALSVIGNALSINPRSLEAQMNFGYALSQLDRLDEAMASFRRAIEMRPDFAEAHNSLATLLALSGRLDEAAASYRRVIDIEPGSAETHNDLGVVLSKLGRHSEAIACYQRATEIEPDYAEAHNNLGNTLSTLDRADDAIAAYQRAIAAEPDYAEAHANLGSLYARNRRFDAATASFRRALAINPDDAEAHNGLGFVLTWSRRPDEALAHYERALVVKPAYAEAHANLGNAFKMLGRLDEARQALERAIELAPHNVAFYASLSEAKRFTKGDPHLAAMQGLARQLASLTSEDRIQIHFALGKAFADLQMPEQGFRHLLEGNRLKRQGIAYDEAAAVGAFDRIRAAFTPELMQTKRGLGHPSLLPVFIFGMPRSGTTLVEQILASHPQVFGAGELTDFADAVAHLGRAGGSAAGFPEAVRPISGPQLAQLGADYLRRIGRLAPTAERVTNKMPANFQFAGLIHLALPNARIIHTRRHPVDTCVSCFSTLFGGDLPYAYDLGELGRYYRGYEALMEHWRAILPDGAMLEVQYEDLVADFANQARRIVAHCGLEWSDACLAFHETPRPVLTASMVQVRQPIYQSAVGRWRSYTNMLGPLLEALGTAGCPDPVSG